MTRQTRRHQQILRAQMRGSHPTKPVHPTPSRCSCMRRCASPPAANCSRITGARSNSGCSRRRWHLSRILPAAIAGSRLLRSCQPWPPAGACPAAATPAPPRSDPAGGNRQARTQVLPAAAASSRLSAQGSCRRVRRLPGHILPAAAATRPPAASRLRPA